MLSDNPSLILQTLDALLNHQVELTLIGKSALWLGFDNPPAQYGVTQDVDAIVPVVQSNAMNEDLAFWDALTAANHDLQSRGIYLTHIFEETQIVIGVGWFERRVPITRPALKHLRLYRPATMDLILTKMMRGRDPQHMEEIRWMIQQDRICRSDLELALKAPQMPPEPEIQEAFRIAPRYCS